mgnify:CR=1 FL=1
MDDKQRMAVSKRIISEGHLFNAIDASQGSKHDESLVQLVRAGVLSSTGTFSCLAVG